MAASNWGTDSRLAESLYASACEFDFFQAVRLLVGDQHQRRKSRSVVRAAPAA